MAIIRVIQFEGRMVIASLSSEADLPKALYRFAQETRFLKVPTPRFSGEQISEKIQALYDSKIAAFQDPADSVCAQVREAAVLEINHAIADLRIIPELSEEFKAQFTVSDPTAVEPK